MVEVQVQLGLLLHTKYYFNKDVSELTLPEAAMLAGSLNSPYNYDPYYCLDKATNRRNTILKLNGYSWLYYTTRI